MAESFATNAMLYLGASGAKTTTFTRDGGVDCISDEFAVQVKHLSSKVGVATVREIIAVAQFASRQPAIFSKSGFTRGALELAVQHDVLLFTYLPFFRQRTM